MTKTLVDIEDDLLEQAAAILDTPTKKATVNQALAETVALDGRRRHLERLVGGGLPDLADQDVMDAAWR